MGLEPSPSHLPLPSRAGEGVPSSERLLVGLVVQVTLKVNSFIVTTTSLRESPGAGVGTGGAGCNLTEINRRPTSDIEVLNLYDPE